MSGEGRQTVRSDDAVGIAEQVLMAIRRPIGVCGLISPWNFPAAIPAWKIFPALLCGNTVVLKPADRHSLRVLRNCVRILDEVRDSSRRVVNLVHGSGEEAGHLSPGDSPRSAYIVHRSSGRRDCGGAVAGAVRHRTCLEMGGKNAQVVLADADLELALEGALWVRSAPAGNVAPLYRADYS